VSRLGFLFDSFSNQLIGSCPTFTENIMLSKAGSTVSLGQWSKFLISRYHSVSSNGRLVTFCFVAIGELLSHYNNLEDIFFDYVKKHGFQLGSGWAVWYH
jgi:hypothetical protein